MAQEVTERTEDGARSECRSIEMGGASLFGVFVEGSLAAALLQVVEVW